MSTTSLSMIRALMAQMLNRSPKGAYSHLRPNDGTSLVTGRGESGSNEDKS